MDRLVGNFRSCITFVIFFAFVSCSYQFESEDYPPADDILLVLTSDLLGSSSLSAITFDENSVYRSFADGHVHTDAGLYYNKTSLYVLNRLGRDNLQYINPADNYATVTELSLKRSDNPTPNPHSLAFSDNDTIYISLYDDSNIVLVDETRLAIKSYIDISDYAYSDEIPCASSLYFHKESGMVFAALQRLDRTSFTPGDYSSLITIDSTVDEVQSELVLAYDGSYYTNPYSALRFVEADKWHTNRADDLLLISCIGNFGLVDEEGVGDGAILALSVSSDGQLEIDSLAVKEEEGFGDIVDFIYLDGLFYLVTLDADENSYFVSYDPIESQYRELAHNSSDAGYLWRVEHDSNGRIYLGDRDAYSPGVRIYDASSSTWITDEALNTGLPPYDLLVIE